MVLFWKFSLIRSLRKGLFVPFSYNNHLTVVKILGLPFPFSALDICIFCRLLSTHTESSLIWLTICGRLDLPRPVCCCQLYKVPRQSWTVAVLSSKQSMFILYPLETCTMTDYHSQRRLVRFRSSFPLWTIDHFLILGVAFPLSSTGNSVDNL